ncbi:Pyridine nucleotide-disulfide oxidoreductase, NAD-binding domain protein [Cordyceps fumosorosea ARSEF 2679]|uniref:Pyridine nucleotide-disulfide oxidoreductase, NAD-binding domain protein n=1 Tax=Cordyceps fumosorosea (strain ARSEF 2679) TaxID=1081104 RepID=A0A168DC86_CORFA|nr:Pyridine nucleotide-disulfide oxidoreductase, NAD-binding domain protein [Cordyceps fumosorosea ARSEF 2679]OAA72427.1 Pyridine nucleotide-disulfide oxidoreductase, NAD-binding domain protein [Cordyceps fumosorosea ARSEF 2679]
MPSAPNSDTTIRVLVAGGSYAGLAVAVNLLDLHRGVSPRMHPEPFVPEQDWPHIKFHITVVDERDGFMHIVGAPLAMADPAYRDRAWARFKDMTDLQADNLTFVHGSLSHVDCAAKTATILPHGTNQAPTTIEYDYFCAATGYRRVWPVVPQALTYDNYLVETQRHIEDASRATHGVLVVGGGAVGIEMAAELKLVMPHLRVVLAHSRDKLLSSEGLSDECKDVSLQLLHDAGVEVLLNHRLESHERVETADGSAKYSAKFTNGTAMDFSMVIVGVSQSVPATDFLPVAARDEDGKVNIQPNLMLPAEIPNSEYHYCAGDATKWSGIKRCGGAMRAGHLVAMNIHQHVLHNVIDHTPKYGELAEIPAMIVMAVGKKAVWSGPEGTGSGEDVMAKFFGNDLYLSGCLSWIGVKMRQDVQASM